MANFGYRKLLSERQYLKVAERARKLHNIKLVSVDYNKAEISFKTESGTTPGLFWTQRLQIVDLETHLALLKVIKLYSSRFATYARAGFVQANQPILPPQVYKVLLNSPLRCDCNCLAEGTRILTKSGYKNIEQVVEGDYVLGSDSQWHVVCGLKKSQLKDNWVKVTVRGMRNPIVVTTDHKLLFSTYRDICACGCGKLMRPLSESYRRASAFSLYNKRRFIPKHAKRPVADNFSRYQMHSLDQYKIGELLCLPLVKGEGQFDVDYARMLGYYLAEGCLATEHGTEVRITLNVNEEETIARDIRQYFQGIGVRVRFERQEYNGRRWLVVHVYSKQFAQDCVKYCGRFSKQKAPNPEILSWSDEAKASFLVGHLLRDGAVDDSFRWLSTSGDLVDMLQMILVSLGVHASTYVSQYANDNRSTCYAVSTSVNDFYHFYNRYKHLFRDKDIISQNNSRGQSNVDEFALYRIISSEPVEPQCGYDLILADEPHNYLANNIIVSNCPAYLYWGFRYIAWKKHYGIVPEHRRPKVRNRFQQGATCFAPDTLVLTKDGFKRIDEVKAGDYVFTHKGRLKKVLSVLEHDADKTIRIRYGSTWITTTNNHSFLAEISKYKTASTRNFKGNLQWVQADELKVGDFLVAPRLILNHSIDVPLREAFIAGLYAADGHMNCVESNTRRGIVCNSRFRCKSNVIALNKDMQTQYHKIWDALGLEWIYSENVREQGTSAVLRISDAACNQRCLDTVNFTNAFLNQEKRISEDILNWSEEAQFEFIKGFFLGDGTIVNGAGKKGSNTVYCTLFNTNKQMMNILFILLKQWYDVKLAYYDRESFEEYGHTVHCKRMYYIRLTGDQCTDFMMRVGADVLMCKGGYKEIRNSLWRLSTKEVEGVIYQPKIIKEIVESGPSKVFNLQVEDDESYIVEDVAVHNCKHLFAVLSLYPLMAKTIERKLLRDKIVKSEYPELEAEKQAAKKKVNPKYITEK